MPNENKMTQWESPPYIPEPKAWQMSSKIMTGLGLLIILMLGAIGTLIVMGFNAQNVKIETGDTAIYKTITDGHAQTARALERLEIQNEKLSNVIMEHTKAIATLQANQCARLEKEKVETEIKIRRGGK